MRIDEYKQIVWKAQSNQNRTNLQLAAWLMCESAEVADIILKKDVYNKEENVNDLISECGDVLHFLQIIAIRYKFTLEDVMYNNQQKLITRGWIS